MLTSTAMYRRCAGTELLMYRSRSSHLYDTRMTICLMEYEQPVQIHLDDIFLENIFLRTLSLVYGLMVQLVHI